MPEINQSNEQTTTPDESIKASTTTFSDESLVQMQKFNEIQIPTSVLPIRDQTIADFMNKPVLIKNDVWSTSVSSGVSLFTFNIESYLTSISQWSNKLEGFALFRGTAVIRLLANANPFQQGKLIMSFSPCGNDMTNDSWRGVCRSQLTQQPCVEMDCRDAVAVMKIPYIAPTEFYDKIKGHFGWGKIRLNVLASLRTGSGGEDNVGYSIFLHFEDFEMAAPIVPQSGVVPHRPKGKSRPSAVKTVSVSHEAEDISSTGSLTRAFAMAAHVASSLTSVPTIAPLAQGCTWVARGLSGVASWFGWSKTHSDQPPCLVSRRMFTNMANSTGVSSAANMGLLHDTSTAIVPALVGTNDDEMSFAYLKDRKAFVYEFTFPDNVAPGGVLYTATVGPSALFETGVSTVATTATNYKSYPPFAYIARQFTLWRGSLVLTLKFVKTDYHTGRILVTFTPHSDATTFPTLTSSVLALREVIDIRCKSEVVLTFPYLLSSNYIRTNEISGTVKVAILNELRHPETANTSIQCLAYWSAGPDFELAVPGFTQDLFRSAPFLPQGGMEVCEDQTIVDEVIGNYPRPAASLDSAAMCIGEQFSSVKQLLNRYTPLVTFDQLPALGTAGIWPFAISGLTQENGSGTMVQPTYMGDALSYFGLGFAFFRGRTNILLSTGNTATDFSNLPVIRACTVTTAINPPLYSSSGYSNYLSHACDYTSQNGEGQLGGYQSFDPVNGAEVAVPYYCQTRMTLVDPFNCVDSAYFDNPLSAPKASVAFTSSRPFTPIYFRSCADDFQLAYFVGFPPIFESYA